MRLNNSDSRAKQPTTKRISPAWISTLANSNGCEIIMSDRPDDCNCLGSFHDLACWACYSEGFDAPNPDPDEDDDDQTQLIKPEGQA